MKTAKTLLNMDPTDLRKLAAHLQVKLAHATPNKPQHIERAKAIKAQVYQQATYWGRWTKVGDEWMVLCSKDARPGDLVMVERRDGDAQEHVVEETHRTFGMRQIARVVK